MRKRRLGFDKLIILIITLVIVFFLGMVFLIIKALWYSNECNRIFNQVTSCTVNTDLTMYGEYEGQTIEITYGNRNAICKTVTDEKVEFTSADKMPEQQPVIISFDDVLQLEVYPAEGKDLFVKYLKGKTVKYYYVKDACDFIYLEKMVSLEGWNGPNVMPGEPQE